VWGEAERERTRDDDFVITSRSVQAKQLTQEAARLDGAVLAGGDEEHEQQGGDDSDDEF
jgi:hypothetical protein